MEKEKTFVLIDGNAIAHRAYHAMPRFEHKGKLVNAVYGFVSILFKIISQITPKYLAVAFDVKGPTFRDKLFADYKAKRIRPEREFYDQIPIIHEFLDSMEIPYLVQQGFEADDIIGSISTHVAKETENLQVVIVTGDQDTLQLVNSRIKVLMPAMGVVKETLYDHSAVIGKLGLSPEQVIDYKALCGDSSDNIPGVKGIGSKTAVKILQYYGSLENFYKNLKKDPESVKLSPKTRQILLAGRKDALFSKKLATIRTDLKLDFKLKDANLHDFNRSEVENFLLKFNFKSLAKRLPESHRHNKQQEKLF